MKARIGNPGEEHVLLTLSAFEPLSHLEYAELAGMKMTAAFGRLRRAWDKKVIYVHHWQRNHAAAPIAFYALGSLPDAEKPKARSNAASNKLYRDKIKKTHPERLTAWGRTANRKLKEKAAADPVYREKIASFKRNWNRKNFGHSPRALSVSANLDEIARQFGITWRFAGRDVRKAA